MMEKQLDFDAPILSVRRLSTKTPNSGEISCISGEKSRPIRQQSLPVTKSQWESEQDLTKPASIPFIWEQIPGQAKDFENPNSLTVLSRTTSVDEHSSEDLHSDTLETLYSEEISDSESSRSFCSDSQTRDYLMNRFLPAAKSMIIETPQYVAKKQEATIPEPPKYVKKVYSGELRPLLLEKYPVNLQNHENDKESVVGDELKKKSSKKRFGFGFFLPRMCTKGAFCLSGSMPGPKTKVHQSESPIANRPGQVPRLSRRGSYSGPLTPSVEKQAMDAVIKKRAESRSKEAHETQRKPNPLARSGNSLPSSPNRSTSRSGRISPYRNESPRSPFHDGARFLGVPKDVQNHIVQPKTCPSLNKKSHFSPRLIYDSPPVVPEKTLYIDWNEKPTNLTTNDAKIKPNGDVDGSVQVPPLPKSPSESWLHRKMTFKSPFPKKAQQVPPRSPKNEPKWETIVKTSKVHHDHVRYSEELLNVSKYDIS
ncbi:hypothetical protein R6Q57_015664 [Mikania cordata]